MSRPLSPTALDPAGPAAAVSAEVGWVLLLGAAAVLLLVFALAAFALARQRSVRPRVWLFGGGLALPLVALSALTAYSVFRSAELRPDAAADALLVHVTAHSWWWEIVYRGPDGQRIVTANEIRIPAGRQVRLSLTSSDVIHSLWVPQLSGKLDLIPDRVNHLVFAADRTGTFRGQCAEFCGEAHAKMALHVVAMPAADFDAWLLAEARSASKPAAERARRGAEVFRSSGCAVCHVVRGVSDTGVGGPDLTHFAARGWIGAGTLPNRPGAVLAWIVGVQELKPGAQMPSYRHLDPDALAALGEFLGGLR